MWDSARAHPIHAQSHPSYSNACVENTARIIVNFLSATRQPRSATAFKRVRWAPHASRKESETRAVQVQIPHVNTIHTHASTVHFGGR